jgi:hypothetical protein
MQGQNMPSDGELLPKRPRVQRVESTESPIDASTQVVVTRDPGVIRRWAAERQATPATGEATSSGPSSSMRVNDGGAGIRFNFPGAATFRSISWEEWLENFDAHECAFVYDSDSSLPLNSRYHIVKASDWNDLLP